MISKNSVQHFKNLYKNRFGEDLADSEAERIATKILNLYIVIYGDRLGLKKHETNEILAKNQDGKQNHRTGTTRKRNKY